MVKRKMERIPVVKRKNAKCPRCGSQDLKPIKSWILNSPRKGTPTKITILLCRNCGKKFRIGENIERKQ